MFIVLTRFHAVPGNDDFLCAQLLNMRLGQCLFAKYLGNSRMHICRGRVRKSGDLSGNCAIFEMLQFWTKVLLMHIR